MYVPSIKLDVDSRMAALLVKLVKASENQECCLKKIKTDILGLSNKVKSHTTKIK